MCEPVSAEAVWTKLSESHKVQSIKKGDSIKLVLTYGMRSIDICETLIENDLVNVVGIIWGVDHPDGTFSYVGEFRGKPI